MPFPEAIARAQRDSLLARVRDELQNLEDMRADLRHGEPHLFAMHPADYFGAIAKIDRAIKELRSIRE